MLFDKKIIYFTAARIPFLSYNRGSMGNWIPGTYLYVHGVFLACGFMAILLPQSVDAVLMVTILYFQLFKYFVKM